MSRAAYEPRNTFQTIQNDYLSKSMYRGSATQTVHYQTNGTGRDSYIARDSGGFCKMYQPYPYKYGEVGTFGGKRHYSRPAPAKQPLNVYYRSDGTGRDSYIISGSGGLTNTGHLLHYKDAFKRSLRAYEDPRITNNAPYVKLGGRQSGFHKAQSTSTLNRTIHNAYDDNSPLQNTMDAVNRTTHSGFYRKRDYLLETQLSFDSKYYHHQKQLRLRQKSMDARLSKPKHQRQKRVESRYSKVQPKISQQQ